MSQEFSGDCALGPGREAARIFSNGVNDMGESSRQGQSGVSLVETLVALALVTSVVLILMQGLRFVVENDGRTNRLQRANLAMATVKDVLRSNRTQYKVCCNTVDCANLLGDGTQTLDEYYKERASTSIPQGGSGTDSTVPGATTSTSTALLPADAPYSVRVSVAGYLRSPSADGAVKAAFTPSCDAATNALLIETSVTLADITVSDQLVKRRPLPGEGG